ncbi:T9SS type A sorting domain-containing protein [Sanyastnella coralliicola]|uniref:T9SS type A sorting domain-containing protein n=1 Tax=Sanyastnella coralliicola TaxID=3069118 RepID=UPI0027B9CADA|nr:T9SS type A sorting domain-containing protein [Longitalea sp. SCSIO 12813]
MKTLITMLSALLLSSFAFSQATGLSVDVYAVHDGMVGTTDLAGYQTYRVYAEFTDSSDELSALYGLLMDDDQPDEQDLLISTNGSCFDHDMGGFTPTHSCNDYAMNPELEYDTYYTLDATSSCDPEDVGAYPTVPSIIPSAVCNSIIDDGVITAWDPVPVGDDHRVLIAQVTTDSFFGINLCLQVFNDNWDDEQQECFELQNILGGCTDPTASNYDVNATVDNGTCMIPMVFGCLDSEACNYNAEANADDGSCVYPGCMDANACNFNSDAGCDDGSCTFPGCDDAEACNYDAAAGCDDGSCTYPGCQDILACNYDADAGCEDNSLCDYMVTYSVGGATDVIEASIVTYDYQETAESTYAWEIEGGTVDSGQGSASVQVLWGEPGNGIVRVIETDATGCIGEAVEIQITIDPDLNVLETDQLNMILFPNPANDVVTIQVPENLKNMPFEIVNVVGQQVLNLGNLQRQQEQIDVNMLATGVYFVKATNANGHFTQRLVIKR